MKIPAFFPVLLNKHVNDKLYVILLQDGKIVMKSGVLEAINGNKIILKATEDGTKHEITIVEKDEVTVLNVYNRNYVDLLVGKPTEVLSLKLKIRDKQKIIMNKLRPNIGKEITMVYKGDGKLVLSYGQFANMGLMGASLKLAPFYNKEQSLNYSSILHIYDSNQSDMLFVG